ncbi:hypothetical protein [Streptomyces sp. NPDC001404]|uniref:DUF6197 family protein n=1 Tax=Streptomyces sp. NPDC001404 TaxID=3364571 RepID=UPI0036AD1F8D
MTDTRPAAVLAAAADYLQTHGWVQGMFRTKAGSVCAMGAIAAVLPNQPTRMIHPGEKAALQALADHLDLKPAPGDTEPLAGHPGTLVTHWNDHAVSHVTEVIAAMRSAANHLTGHAR